MKKNHKVLKIVIICLIIAICIILLGYFIIIEKLKKSYNDTSWSSDTTPAIIKEEIEEVSNRNLYYVIKNVSTKYYEYIKNYNTDVYYSKLEGNVVVSEEDKKSIYTSICDMLDSEYIKSNNINDNSIKNILNSYKNSDDIKFNKVYSKDINDTTTMFWADISLLKEHKKNGNDNVIVGKLDRKNGLFSIIPVQLNKQQIMQNDINISTNEIESNAYNKYEFKTISDEQVVTDFLTKYRDAALYNREDAYNMLDEEYRKKRFEDYSTFSKYIDTNINKMAKLTFKKYLVKDYDEYKEYICQDEEENIYIFHEKAVMDCYIILDTYTLLLPQFTEKYDGANENEKVAMNIDKIVQALNWNDVKYIYDKLDTTFKEKNFATLNDFENYMNTNYKSTYDLEYSTYSEENGVYVQNIILKDKKSQDSKNVTIIMKLENDYKFVMSFS